MISRSLGREVRAWSEVEKLQSDFYMMSET